MERSFADAQELHGHRYARFRGLSKVQAQYLLPAACQNMKKMALLLARKAALLWLKIFIGAPFADPSARSPWRTWLPNLNFRIRRLVAA